MSIEELNQFHYLGTIIEANGKQDTDINKRINKTIKMFYDIKSKLINCRDKTKMTVFNTIYRIVLFDIRV